MRPAIFLDRDGVLIANREDHVKSRAEVAFEPGAFEALHRLGQTGYFLVVITNQAVVGRGIIRLETAEQIQREVIAEIRCRGGRIDASYLCPHHPDDGCDCRKPRPGMLLRAAKEHELDLEKSYLIGDAVSDMEAAGTSGVRGILVQSGRGRQQQEILATRPTLQCTVVSDLAAAVTYILQQKDSQP